MGTRIELQKVLETLLGSKNVYFQPPTTVQMSYPCIVYRRTKIRSKFANNSNYLNHKEYTVTVIDKDPDSLIPDKLVVLPMCLHDRQYTANNLNHDVFTLFF
jgi:hypothetical protein